MRMINQKGFSPILPLIILLIVGGLSAAAALTVYNKPRFAPLPSPSPATQANALESAESGEINVAKFDPLLPTNNLISTFQKTIIGKTTDAQILKLVDFKAKEGLVDGGIQYSFKAYLVLRDNLIITKGGVAVFERIVTVPNNLIHPRVSEYSAKYGAPETKLVGSKFYGPFENIYVYASKGVAIIGNPVTDEVDEIQVFLPLRAGEYVGTWGQDYLPGEGFLKEAL